MFFWIRSWLKKGVYDKDKKIENYHLIQSLHYTMSRMCYKQVLVTREYQKKHVFSFFELVKYIMGYNDDLLGLATLRLDITCIHIVFPGNTTSILWQECSIPLCRWEKFCLTLSTGDVEGWDEKEQLLSLKFYLANYYYLRIYLECLITFPPKQFLYVFLVIYTVLSLRGVPEISFFSIFSNFQG